MLVSPQRWSSYGGLRVRQLIVKTGDFTQNPCSGHSECYDDLQQLSERMEKTHLAPSSEYHAFMDENEIVVVAAPRNDYVSAILESLKLEGIPARELAIKDVVPARRPEWACTPGDEVYVVVPNDTRSASLEIVRWTSRSCLKCHAMLLAKARFCRKCGAPHPMEPGPVTIQHR
jgi:ribosomal protein L40E